VQKVRLHEAVNVRTDPSLRDEIMSNRLNAVTCGECGFTFRVDKPLLYSDPDRGFMVNLLPATEDAAGQSQHQFSEWLQEMNQALPEGLAAPTVHLVFSRVELVERIFLLEAGLNERIIEYIKYIIYSKNMERLSALDKAILFDAEDSTDDALCFVVQDVKSRKLEEMLQYSRQAYHGLCEMFDRDEQTPSLMELFPGPHISARAILLQDAVIQQPGSE
jgi:hypothetical protein